MLCKIRFCQLPKKLMTESGVLFQANAGATIKLLKGFSFRNTTGMRYQTRRNDIFTVISP